MKSVPKNLCGKESAKCHNKEKNWDIFFKAFLTHSWTSISQKIRIMKFRQRLTTLKNDLSLLMQQKGQSLVEFVLLLAVISMLSYSFVAVMNSNLGSYWEHCVNIVVNDGDTTKPKLTID